MNKDLLGRLRMSSPTEEQWENGLVILLLLFMNLKHDMIFQQTGKIAGDYVRVNIMDNRDGTLRSEIVEGSVHAKLVYKDIESDVLEHVMSLCDKVEVDIEGD